MISDGIEIERLPELHGKPGRMRQGLALGVQVGLVRGYGTAKDKSVHRPFCMDMKVAEVRPFLRIAVHVIGRKEGYRAIETRWIQSKWLVRRGTT